jgi:hypothetical protein
MNKSKKHFWKAYPRQWQSKELPVCESVISIENESELREKNFPMCWLDLMQSRHNATLDYLTYFEGIVPLSTT